MYTLNQYSLKEYEVVNLSTVDSLTFYVEKYSNIGSNPNDTTGVWENVNLLTTVTPGDSSKIGLSVDGVYKITINFTKNFSNAVDTYIVHNIADLLEQKQYFLTKLLTEYRVDPKHHNQYYDFISFSVLFETYNRLVKNTFVKTTGISNLHMIEYLLEQLQKLYRNG